MAILTHIVFFYRASNNRTASIKRTKCGTQIHMACKERQFDVKMMMNNKFKAFKAPKNRARGNRKTLKRPKIMSKINFRNLKLKSHEEYLICRTYFVQSKT